MRSPAKRKDLPEEKLMAAIFGEKQWGPLFPLCYPYIVIGEEGEESVLTLKEAIHDALESLLSAKSTANLARRKQVIELRFGLNNGISRTLRQVGEELGIRHVEQVRQIEAQALWMLQQSSHSRRLREFLVPSPQEVAERNKQQRELEEIARRATISNFRLTAILEGLGLKEEDLQGARLKDIPSAAEVLRELMEDREAFQALVTRFPDNGIWNAVKRGMKINLSLTLLNELVETGDILKFRDIGVKRAQFIKQALQTAEQEAPS